MKSEARAENRGFHWRRGSAVLALACNAALLSGCHLPVQQAGSPPQTQTVQLDGLSYHVEQITAGTWAVQVPRTLPDGPFKTGHLAKAVEKASNCKVTDSSYGAQGATFNAQVDCGSRLKN